MTDAELAEREKQLKADMDNLEIDSGNLRARRDAALQRPDKGADLSLDPYAGERLNDEERIKAINEYTASVVRLNNVQKELEQITAARMQKSIEEMGGQVKIGTRGLPPGGIVVTNTGVSHDVPLPSSVSIPQDSVDVTNLPSLGSLGGVDISGIVSTLTNIDGSLTSIAAALSTSNEVFTALQTYLSTVSVPLVLDAESTAALTTFNKKFGEHVDKLASLSLPDTISIVARHTVTVDIRGAEIFGQLEEDMQRLVVLEVNRELNRQTDGQLGSNYQP